MSDPFESGELPLSLRQDYLRGARESLDALAALVARLAARGDDVEVLGAIRREAHKVRGSAGSYGFAEASQVAAELEEIVKAWLDHPVGSDHAGMRGGVAATLVRRLAASLPLEQEAAEAAQSSAAIAGPATAAEGSRPPADVPEVILVEDDPALLELMEYGLKTRGYRYVVYRNGREALAALVALDVASARPLLLLDVDLPALDGYSMLDALQRERPGVFRAVFTTVHGTEEEQLRGLQAGAIDYLVKPSSLQVALEKIRRWVGR